MAAQGLHCWAWASCCGGFSCCGAQVLGVRASVPVARGVIRKLIHHHWTTREIHVQSKKRTYTQAHTRQLTLLEVIYLPLQGFCSKV